MSYDVNPSGYGNLLQENKITTDRNKCLSLREVQPHEENIPAEKAPEKGRTRLQKENGYCQRQKGPEEKTCKGQSKADLLISCCPRSCAKTTMKKPVPQVIGFPFCHRYGVPVMRDSPTRIVNHHHPGYIPHVRKRSRHCVNVTNTHKRYEV